MAFTRWHRLGLTTVVFAVIVVGGTALVVQGAQDPSGTGTTDARATKPAPDASETASPRATPAAAQAAAPIDAGVQKQLAYMLAHWKNYNTAAYGVVTGNDCVNFTNQSLIERGWTMDATWNSSGTGSNFTHTPAWVSSTALMHYLADSGRATALTDAQRDQVKLGDIVQFDWDKSGDRDHTGVVTRIEGSGANIVIYYAGHTEDTDYRSVDYAITERHPGGTAYYWSIP